MAELSTQAKNEGAFQSDFITWAAGDTTSIPLKIIPTPKSIQISDGDIGYYDTLNKTYDGVYNILDENGKQLVMNNSRGTQTKLMNSP